MENGKWFLSVGVFCTNLKNIAKAVRLIFKYGSGLFFQGIAHKTEQQLENLFGVWSHDVQERD